MKIYDAGLLIIRKDGITPQLVPEVSEVMPTVDPKNYPYLGTLFKIGSKISQKPLYAEFKDGYNLE